MVVVTISTLVTQLPPVETPHAVRNVVLSPPEELVSSEEVAKLSSPRSDYLRLKLHNNILYLCKDGFGRYREIYIVILY